MAVKWNREVARKLTISLRKEIARIRMRNTVLTQENKELSLSNQELTESNLKKDQAYQRLKAALCVAQGALREIQCDE